MVKEIAAVRGNIHIAPIEDYHFMGDDDERRAYIDQVAESILKSNPDFVKSSLDTTRLAIGEVLQEDEGDLVGYWRDVKKSTGRHVDVYEFETGAVLVESWYRTGDAKGALYGTKCVTVKLLGKSDDDLGDKIRSIMKEEGLNIVNIKPPTISSHLTRKDEINTLYDQINALLDDQVDPKSPELQSRYERLQALQEEEADVVSAEFESILDMPIGEHTRQIEQALARIDRYGDSPNSD